MRAGDKRRQSALFFNGLLGKVKIDTNARAEIAELADTLRDNLDKIVQHGKRATPS